MRAAPARAIANNYILPMCGRVIQSSGPLRYAIVDGMNVPTAACTTIRRGGTARRARTCWSSPATTRPARYRSIRCAGDTVHVDDKLCNNCEAVLPYVGLELGNPTVTFVDPTGTTRTMRDGAWLD
jgi:hypothetical protein